VYTPLPLILCYHAVGSALPSGLSVPVETLDLQLSLLRQRGYLGLTFAEAERRRLARTLHRRTAVVTFDDGFVSTLLAQPILEEAGFPATVFVPTHFIDTGKLLSYADGNAPGDRSYAKERRPLTWEQLRRLRDAGWEVGSHTVNHPRLPELNDADLARELEVSRKTIEDRLGGCETIAYPYGLADARVAAAAERAGYLAGCTLTAGHSIDERFRRARVGLYPSDTGLRLRAKLSPALRAARRTPLADLAQGARARLGRVQPS
jgi:peptidoglycan/xylan/chitin deacetylase (PgdA/CDA1 family)